MAQPDTSASGRSVAGAAGRRPGGGQRCQADNPFIERRFMPTSRRDTGSTSADNAGDELQESMRTRAVDPVVEARPARPAKTSAAAVFGLVFGLAALFCALTGILAPAAVVFGVIGLILAVVGIKMAKRIGITGKGVAIGGLVTSLVGLILGGVVLAGITAVVNDQKQLDRVQRYIDDARSNLPSTDEVKDKIPGQ
jgi:hypothetical protein